MDHIHLDFGDKTLITPEVQCHSLHPVITWQILDPALAAPSREMICNNVNAAFIFAAKLEEFEKSG